MEPSFTRIFIASVKFLARLAIAAKQIRLSRIDQRIPVRAEIFSFCNKTAKGTLGPFKGTNLIVRVPGEQMTKTE